MIVKMCIWAVCIALTCSVAATIATAHSGDAVRGTAPLIDEPLLPLPLDTVLDHRKVALGAKLFRDKRFSKDDSVACMSCHRLEHGGADPRAFSVGAGGVRDLVNTPTVFNSGFNFRQQWSGGAVSLDDIVDKVVASPRVFASNWPSVLAKLSRDAALVAAFNDAYPDGLTAANARDALVTYDRSLITPSRFDRFLRGDVTAISANEKRGYARFKAYGCVGCHQGVNVGGNMFQRFGAMNDYFKARAAAGWPVTKADRGRYNVTGRPEDLYVFKVPSLRNVALTPPYFHDASARTLADAVDVMFRFQLGRSAPKEDKELIIAFLKSLNGTLQSGK